MVQDNGKKNGKGKSPEPETEVTFEHLGDDLWYEKENHKIIFSDEIKEKLEDEEDKENS